jgi:FAD binding domain/Berberine and berberine like
VNADGFTGRLVLPSDPGYDAAKRLWNAMIDKRPAMIARCQSTADVVAALALARGEGLEVAVRCGGHSVSGLSSTDGGIMIDLRPMSRVIVDRDRRHVRVQGGTLLRELDRATHAFSLATTGGMVHHTGVGGLTLGGGYGWLARLHGLACDNLVSAELVTASGDVVRAAGDKNDDLFWGIRGGGGNFGIVTEFEFRLHDITPVLSVQLRYRAADGPSVLRAYRDVMASAPPELCGLAGVSTGRGAGRLSDKPGQHDVFIWFAYVGSDLDEGGRLGGPFRRAARPIAEQVEVLTYPELQSATGEASGPGRRHYWKGSLMWELSDAFIDALLERGRALRGGCGIELFSLGGAISRLGEEDSAYSNRGAAFDMLPAATWDDPGEDDLNISLTRENWAGLAPFARSAVYVNDLGPDAFERVEEVYGSQKLGRLAALKARWDPDNVFHLNANIAPVRA